MKKTVLLALVAFIFTIACKKDKTTPQPKVKTKTEGGITQIYAYDAQGRLNQIQYSSSASRDTVIYKTDSVSVYTISSGSLSLRYGVPLNSKGLASNYSTGLFSSEIYLYNSDDYRVRTEFSGIISSARDTAIVSNGNFIKHIKTTYEILVTTQLVDDYTFSDKSNSLSNEALGIQYNGKSNKNLISSRVSTNTTISCPAPSCGTPVTTTYNYSGRCAT